MKKMKPAILTDSHEINSLQELADARALTQNKKLKKGARQIRIKGKKRKIATSVLKLKVEWLRRVYRCVDVK